MQALFALAESEGGGARGRDRLLAHRIEHILILHIGVAERFSSTGANADAMLVMRLLQAVRDAVRRLKGVRTITIVYPAGQRLTMPVAAAQSRMVSAAR